MNWFIGFRSYNQIKLFWGIIHLKQYYNKKSHKGTYRATKYKYNPRKFSNNNYQPHSDQDLKDVYIT